MMKKLKFLILAVSAIAGMATVASCNKLRNDDPTDDPIDGEEVFFEIDPSGTIT